MTNDQTDIVSIKLADIAATERVAIDLASTLQLGDVVGLSGDLGVGKTVLARAVIQGLAQKYNIVIDHIPSPTFTLVQQYDFPAFSLLHIDLYRIERPEDTLELGLEDFFAEGICLIEWPEQLGPYLPEDRLHLTLYSGDHESDRMLQIEEYGAWRTRSWGFRTDD